MIAVKIHFFKTLFKLNSSMPSSGKKKISISIYFNVSKLILDVITWYCSQRQYRKILNIYFQGMWIIPNWKISNYNILQSYFLLFVFKEE